MALLALALQFSHLFGSAHGLDHLTLEVRDSAAAFRDYESLGFRVAKWGSFPDGWDNGGIYLPDHTYFEFLWSRDAKLTGPVAADHIDSLGLETSDLNWTRNWLKAAKVDFEVSRYPEDPQKELRWSNVIPKGLAGTPFFIEYGRGVRTKPQPPQPNGVDSVTAVWIVVRDLSEEIGKYAQAGFEVDPESVTVGELAVKARRIKAGKGWIVLAQPIGEGFMRTHLNKVGRGAAAVTFHCADTAKMQVSADLRDGWWPGGLLPTKMTHGVLVTVWSGRNPGN